MMKLRLIIYGMLLLHITARAQKDSARILPEASISANRVKLIYKSARYSVIDYTFFDSGLLIIAGKGNFNPKPALLLLNADGDTLAQGNISVYPQKLFRNCAGSPYMLTDDSLYRIRREGGRLVCGTAYPAWMADMFASCQAMMNGNFYYKAGDAKHCSVSFTRRSLSDTMLRPFTTFEDSLAASVIKYDMDRFRAYILSNVMAAENLGIWYNGWDELTAISYEVAQNMGFNRHNFRDMLASTDLYPLDDSSLLITDYIHKRLWYFTDTGAIISATPMEQDWSDFHNNTLLRDEVTGRFYIHFSKYGRFQKLKELKLREGITEGAPLAFEQPFAERVSVHDGRVYFLQHDPNGGAVRQLFVQRW